MAPKVGKTKAGKAGKTLKKNKWTENKVFIFATILSSLEARDKPWAIVLETLALKKTANESIFTKILEEFEDVLANEGADGSFLRQLPFTS